MSPVLSEILRSGVGLTSFNPSPSPSSTGSISSVFVSMASTSGNSSEEDLQQLERKRKRMQSNRESARRSRMKKQKHLDDLTAQSALLRRDNGQILATLQVTTQQRLNVEAENSVLRARLAELTNRLDSLHGIMNYMSSAAAVSGGGTAAPAADLVVGGDNALLGSHWNLGYVANQQPIMASADFHVFGY
ncbi:hypothetical protein V2J09_017072 [Rumex salicifolius]